MLTRALVLAALVASAGQAIGDDGRHDADEHARRGVALYRLGRFDQAIDEFEQAYLLYPSNTLLYNLGQAHRKLDHCREALDYYRRFLEAQPDSPLAPKVSNWIGPLENACGVKNAKPDDVATAAAPPPPASPEPAVTTAVTFQPPEPERPLRFRVGLGAQALVSGGAATTPVGFSLAATAPLLEGRLELGGYAAAGWSPGDPGMTSSAVTLLATGGRSWQRGDLVLHIAGGAGAVVLSSLQRGLVADARTDRATIVVPALAVLASVDYAVAPSWSASLGADVSIGPSSDLRGGMIAGAGASLAMVYRR